MDNNFSSIVTSIKFGRNIIDNLRKFLQFQSIINFSICFLVITCSCIGSQTPLKTIQMLWIDLIMDSLGSLSLATEPPHDDLLKRKPTRKNEHIINMNMVVHIFFQSMSEFIILMIFYLYGPHFVREQNTSRILENELILKCFGKLPGNVTDTKKILYGISSYWSNEVELNRNLGQQCGDYNAAKDLSEAYALYSKHNGSSVHLTMIFNVYVLYTLFNQINCRVIGDKGNICLKFKNNPLFIVILIFEFVIQVTIIEFWNVIFKVNKHGLTIEQWGICFALSIFTFILELLLNFIPVEQCFNWIYGKIISNNDNGVKGNSSLQDKEKFIELVEDKMDKIRVVVKE